MKGIIYYTDNKLGSPIFPLVQTYLLAIGLPIVSASLKPIDFGDNAVIKRERGYHTIVKQIISCLKRSTAKYVFFTEHDVLYSKSHFDFTPPKDDIFYYNENVWRWMFGSDTVIRYNRMIPLSCMCANRELALKHYQLRTREIKERGWKQDSREPRWVRKMGYEPGTKKKKRGGITDDNFETWSSKYPNIDIRHKGTFSPAKVKQKDFKHKPKQWKEIPIEEIPEWDLNERFKHTNTS